MNTITKKVVSGLTGLAIAMPLTIGVAFAEDSTESIGSTSATMTQACIDARTAADDALITAKNTQNTSEVAAIQTHKAALIAAFALTDATAKKAAFKKAEMDMRTSMKAAMDAFRIATKASMDAVKTACGSKADEGRMMENRDKGSKDHKGGMMNKVMNALGRDKKMKGPKSDESSSSDAR